MECFSRYDNRISYEDSELYGKGMFAETLYYDGPRQRGVIRNSKDSRLDNENDIK